MKHYEPDTLSFDERYRIMTTITTPRPIGWISTLSDDGIPNLAPFSHYNNVSVSTPVVMFSSAYINGEQLKDTARNVEETGEFVANLVTEDLAFEMDETSAKLPSDESEFDFAHIKKADSYRVRPPRVAEAKAALECELYDSFRVYNNRLIFGEVVTIHISEDIMTDGKIDMNKIHSVGRLGGPYYTGVNSLDLTRNY